uniref:Uncharacterized protein n=1 Tax=Chenopodium quinoa TaxID=63459 RepID=A0A803LRU2_CHEQI
MERWLQPLPGSAAVALLLTAERLTQAYVFGFCLMTEMIRRQSFQRLEVMIHQLSM